MALSQAKFANRVLLCASPPEHARPTRINLIEQGSSEAVPESLYTEADYEPRYSVAQYPDSCSTSHLTTCGRGLHKRDSIPSQHSMHLIWQSALASYLGMLLVKSLVVPCCTPSFVPSGVDQYIGAFDIQTHTVQWALRRLLQDCLGFIFLHRPVCCIDGDGETRSP